MDDDIQDTIMRYHSCIHMWNASYEQYAKSVGLSHTALSILRAVDETEQCTQKMLCETCFLPKQTVNTVITAFYKDGWIRLEELAEDRRNKTVHLTAKGKKVAEKILAPIRKSEHHAMSVLSPEQREILLSITNTYISNCIRAITGE